MGWTSKPEIEKNNDLTREWMSTKLFEYESLWCEYQMVECELGQVAQKWASASWICQ